MSIRLKDCGSFEEACRKAPFSELIRLAVWLAGAARRLADRASQRAARAPRLGSSPSRSKQWRMPS